MKKVLAVAAVVGLLAVPSVAFASRGADDSQNGNTYARQEDRRADRQLDRRDDRREDRQEDRQDDRREDRREDRRQDHVTPVTNPSTMSSTETEARRIAQSLMPNKTITHVEHEFEDGVAVTSVRFSDNSRVDVDVSGNVVRVEDRSVMADNYSDDNEHDDDNSGSNNYDDNSGSNRGSGNSGRGHYED